MTITWTGNFSTNSGTGPVVDDLTFANISLLHSDLTTRGARGSSFSKIAGVDALPSGMSISNQLITVASGADIPAGSLDGWDFRGYGWRMNGRVRRFRDCVFGYDTQTLAGVSNAFFRVGVTGLVDQIEWCSFLGPAYFGTIPKGGELLPCIRDEISGGGANVNTGKIASIRRCEFIGWGEDTLKSGWDGLVEFNYFDTPCNTPAGTKPWQSGQSYAAGDWVVANSNRHAFGCKVAHTASSSNRPPSNKSSNTTWQNYDPHCDGVNPRRQTGAVRGYIVRANFINRNLGAGHVTQPGWAQGERRGVGFVNGFRNLRNSGNTDTHNGSTLEYNIITAKAELNDGIPVELGPGSGTNLQASIARNNWINPDNQGNQFGNMNGHTVSGNANFTPPATRAAGYDGPSLT